MNSQFTCPLSGQGLQHPCPISSCPANLSHADPTHSCAYVLPDTSYDTLAGILRVEPSEVRMKSQQQISELGQIMQDVHKVLETNLPHSCPNCGYITLCTSATICDERKETVEAILVNVVGEVSLKPPHIWHALLNGQDSFLNQDQRDSLLELANQKHVRNRNDGKQPESSREAMELASRQR